MKFTLPEGYVQIGSLPEDGPGAMAFGRMSEASSVFVQIKPIAEDEAMPIGDCQAVIDGVHGSLAEDQGLVEVNGGTTVGGGAYIYSIVKNRHDEHGGNDYVLRLDINSAKATFMIVAAAQEMGDTGVRETAVFELLSRQGVLDGDGAESASWSCDPYGASRTQGYLMNLSEDPKYDRLFPEHPLSQIRELERSLIENI